MNKEKAQLEEEISKYLGGLGPDSIRYEYLPDGSKIKLNLITINPRHNQSFLFHSETGYDEKDCLNKMLDYVKEYKVSESSYTIQWSEKDSNELVTSYFRARNLPEALDKFLFGRDVNSLVIFSVDLNPLT